MYFTNVTTKATALAIVAMAASHVAMKGVAAAPVALSQADYLRNGQDAQQANKQFEGVTVQDPCNAGEKACIGRNFAVCSPENDWEVTPCPESLRCFSLPTKSGTTISCAAPDDAQAWIEDTGAKGGINGDDSVDGHNHNEGDEDEVSSTLVATTTANAVETGTSSTGLPTVTSTPAATDIPGINIPLGDALSDKLPTTTTDAAGANSTLSCTEITDSPTASTTCSTSTVTDASDGSSTVSTSAASSAASGRFTTRLTTTVFVTPTECSTTDVSESSMAQDPATAPSLVTFTTHPFSPIPVSTSTSAYDATSTPDGYIIGSSSSAAPVTTSPTDSVSFITQTGTQSFPIGGTLSTITLSDLPAESASSSTTSDVPAYSYSYSSEPSIPPLGAAATPAVIVLPPHFTPI